MYSVGIDCGTSSVKFLYLRGNKILYKDIRQHKGQINKCLNAMLKDFLTKHPEAGNSQLCITGSSVMGLAEEFSGLCYLGEIPAIVEGIRLFSPAAESIIEIGSQNARYITGLQETGSPKFAVNEHCAGGTGSFFENQMSRLGMQIEDYSRVASRATAIPRISGRCAVFAKTDIVHRQQEGATIADILLGLSYAMIRNYRAVIVKKLPVNKPVVLCGGIAHNESVIKAVKEVFELNDDELLIPENPDFIAAAGAALEVKNRQSLTVKEFAALLSKQRKSDDNLIRLKTLELADNTDLHDPIPAKPHNIGSCFLGVDVGSTSTNVVLVDADGQLLDFQYLRTAGEPETAVRNGFASIKERFGDIEISAAAVTGSGRNRIGEIIGADLVRDEITAQAKAATKAVPDADTVFEIGGQDSKYISLVNGEVAEFQMNKICAAGTGSFIEEQAVRMAIPLDEFGSFALKSGAPVELGERCTVFIETAIASALAQGAIIEDIAAGLCHSIVRNYLHKVVKNNPVGNKIVLQGGIAYNPGIVAAFQEYFGDRLIVSPYFPVSGAYGAALLALEGINGQKTKFKGLDMSGIKEDADLEESIEIDKNISFYEKASELLLEGYEPTQDPGKKTVGVPYALMIYKLFPMANAFFKTLGFNVLLSGPSNEEIVSLSQRHCQGEPCYPVKLLHGHMLELANKNVDYIFMPSMRTMKHGKSKVKNNYGCVYMQSAAKLVAKTLSVDKRNIKLLNPVIDLALGEESMVMSMIGIGMELGFEQEECINALSAGIQAVLSHEAAVKAQGEALLSALRPDEKVLVIITRNYGITDPVLNMGIPKILLESGHKVITLAHLSGHDLDISQDHPNQYWPFGQHILSGAKQVRHHPNLYAVYITNHGCGPDTMLSHLFKQEMGDKPYLQIEVDEHFSPVGVITRIEAFLNSLKQRATQPVPADFDICDVPVKESGVSLAPQNDVPLWISDMSHYTNPIAEYFRKAYGVDTRLVPAMDKHQLMLGREDANSKEYLPFVAYLGSLKYLAKTVDTPFQYLIPSTEGSEADGQYARAIRAIVPDKDIGIVAPVLERLPDNAKDIDLLFRAVMTGDLLFSSPPALRTEFLPNGIPEWDVLYRKAECIGAYKSNGIKLFAVGEPLCLYVLNDGIFAKLEQEGYSVAYAPLSEYLYFLWVDAGIDNTLLAQLKAHMDRINGSLGAQSSFSNNYDELTSIADKYLPRFAGGNGRYRMAKAAQSSKYADAVLSVAPRYENTATVMEMSDVKHDAPVYQLAMDNDWDENAWSLLKSFLYYIKK